MNKFYQTLLFSSTAILFSCTENGSQNQSSGTPQVVTSERTTDTDYTNTLYASVDSTFEIEQQNYRVHVDQFDLSEQAYAEGDTLPRPTYLCTMEIYSASGTVLFQDSLYRDSWGYPGKIESIQAYQLNFPQLYYLNDEIVAAYNIYEMNSMDAIIGSVAFNVKNHQSRMFWEEAYIE